MELIAGHYLPQCSVLLTSRPHAVAHIEPSFENVLQIKGFSRDHAEIVCDKALHSKDQKNAVVLFYENNFMRGGITFASPMLLQFICILVKNDTDLDLARNKLRRAKFIGDWSDVSTGNIVKVGTLGSIMVNLLKFLAKLVNLH